MDFGCGNYVRGSNIDIFMERGGHQMAFKDVSGWSLRKGW